MGTRHIKEESIVARLCKEARRLRIKAEVPLKVVEGVLHSDDHLEKVLIDDKESKSASFDEVLEVNAGKSIGVCDICEIDVLLEAELLEEFLEDAVELGISLEESIKSLRHLKKEVARSRVKANAWGLVRDAVGKLYDLDHEYKVEVGGSLKHLENILRAEMGSVRERLRPFDYVLGEAIGARRTDEYVLVVNDPNVKRSRKEEEWLGAARVAWWVSDTQGIDLFLVPKSVGVIVNDWVGIEMFETSVGAERVLETAEVLAESAGECKNAAKAVAAAVAIEEESELA